MYGGMRGMRRWSGRLWRGFWDLEPSHSLPERRLDQQEMLKGKPERLPKLMVMLKCEGPNCPVSTSVGLFRSEQSHRYRDFRKWNLVPCIGQLRFSVGSDNCWPQNLSGWQPESFMSWPCFWSLWISRLCLRGSSLQDQVWRSCPLWGELVLWQEQNKDGRTT